MRRLSLFLIALCGLITLLGATPRPSAEADSLFLQKDYVGATKAYEALIQTEGSTVSRLFNLGNSYYQQGQLGQAMLAYERAQLLDPRDQGLREVRSFLARKTVDKLPAPDGWLRQLGDSLAYALPLSAWLILCPLFFIGSLVGWVIFSLSETPRLRRLSFYPAVVTLGLSLLSGALIAHWLSAPKIASERAVIVLPEVSLYAEPNTESTLVTKLHEGARLQLLGKKTGGFALVELADGRRAWIAERTLETIAPLPSPASSRH